CFSTKKRPLLSPSDNIIVIGSATTGNKVRINYIINQSRNTEENMLEGSSDWTYYLSLISAIIVTIGFVVGVLVVLGIIPISFGSPWGFFGAKYSMIIFIILIIALLPAMIIFWVITYLFSKKRKNAIQLSEDVSRIKENLSGSFKPNIKSSEVVKEPTSVQKKEDLYSPRPQFCAHCGIKMSFEARFCPSCGSEQ
ncbi:MAG: zinc ribbon domain-containing protein, partial [Candidatus Lokiarchaeota archaeon]|nr:zinc ribbon domain-containing protein [Candidatus Lokiarchaeota archaeon]